MRGRIRVSPTSDLGRNLLLGWLDEFNVRYPDVSLSVILSDTKLDLLHEEIGLALRFCIAQDSSFIARPLEKTSRALCDTPTHPSELAPHRFIVLSSRGSAASKWSFQRDGITEVFKVPLEDARETNDGALARAWALSGHGLVMKSMWDVSADVQSGQLAVVLPAWSMPAAPIYARYQRSQYMPSHLKVQVDFL